MLLQLMSADSNFFVINICKYVDIEKKNKNKKKKNNMFYGLI